MSFFARSVYGCMGVCVRVIHAISPFLSPGSRPFGKFSFWRWVFLVMGPLLANAKKHNKRNYLRSTRFFLCHHLVVFFSPFRAARFALSIGRQRLHKISSASTKLHNDVARVANAKWMERKSDANGPKGARITELMAVSVQFFSHSRASQR